MQLILNLLALISLGRDGKIAKEVFNQFHVYTGLQLRLNDFNKVIALIHEKTVT